MITECIMPQRDDVELISIAETGKEVSPYYDSLIAQIIIRGSDREDVVKKMYDYLDTVVIKGIATNIPLLKRILKDTTFNEGVYDTNYLPRLMAELDIPELIAEMEAAAQTVKVDTESLVKVMSLKYWHRAQVFSIPHQHRVKLILLRKAT